VKQVKTIMAVMLTITTRGGSGLVEDAPLVRVLSSLAARGKAGRFIRAVLERHDPWDSICLLEADLLECGEGQGWEIVVGTCATLPDVPAYVGWGHVSAWLEYGDWVVTLGGPDEEERKGDDLVVWERDEFYEHCAALVIARSPFGRDSGARLNAVFRQIAGLEALL
jgi:hypothetical protein